MNTISNTLAPLQSTFQMGVSTSASHAPAPQATAATAKGDTATISDEGKALAKGASDKDTDGDSASNTAKLGQAAAASKAIITADLQSAQIKQKSLKSRLDEAKQEAQANPDSVSQVDSLTAQLNAANTAVTKAQVKVYS